MYSARLGYVSLVVPDVGRTADFYRSVLSFEVGHTGSPNTFRSLRLGDTGLGISWPGVTDLLEIDSTTTSFITFSVDNEAAVEEATREFVARGAKLVVPARWTGYGTFQSVLQDPDGHVFRLDFQPERTPE